MFWKMSLPFHTAVPEYLIQSGDEPLTQMFVFLWISPDKFSNALSRPLLIHLTFDEDT
jgi:hypothetical protein